MAAALLAQIVECYDTAFFAKRTRKTAIISTQPEAALWAAQVSSAAHRSSPRRKFAIIGVDPEFASQTREGRFGSAEVRREGILCQNW
jgi:hypothetical protein